MATMPMVPTPPGDQSSPMQGPVSPTSPMSVTPNPAQSGSQANQAAFATLQIVQAARQLAQQFPQVSPLMRQVNDIMQQAQMVIGSQADSGEASAPPIG